MVKLTRASVSLRCPKHPRFAGDSGAVKGGCQICFMIADAKRLWSHASVYTAGVVRSIERATLASKPEP